MKYRNPKYEQKIIKKWRTNSVSTKFVYFWVVSVRKYMVKKYFIFDRFYFLCRFFSRFFYNEFFVCTKFTRSSSDKPIIPDKITLNESHSTFSSWTIYSPLLIKLIRGYALSSWCKINFWILCLTPKWNVLCKKTQWNTFIEILGGN